MIKTPVKVRPKRIGIALKWVRLAFIVLCCVTMVVSVLAWRETGKLWQALLAVGVFIASFAWAWIGGGE